MTASRRYLDLERKERHQTRVLGLANRLLHIGRRGSPARTRGGRDGSHLWMAVIREHLAARGLGLHNDLQNEHSIVGNNVALLLMVNYGTDEQKAEWIDDLAEGRRGFAFGITEPDHGSDATHMETTAVRDGDEWVCNGQKWSPSIWGWFQSTRLRCWRQEESRLRIL